MRVGAREIGVAEAAFDQAQRDLDELDLDARTQLEPGRLRALADLPAARELWGRLWPLCELLESQSYPAAVKTACALVGDSTGPVRAPLLPLDAEATSALGGLLDHARSRVTPTAAR